MEISMYLSHGSGRGLGKGRESRNSCHLITPQAIEKPRMPAGMSNSKKHNPSLGIASSLVVC
jgi:hypothetical protein